MIIQYPSLSLLKYNFTCLFLAVLGLHRFGWVLSGCGERVLSEGVHRLQIHGLQLLVGLVVVTRGLSGCGPWVPCGLLALWQRSLLGLGIEPMTPALADGFLSLVQPGKSSPSLPLNTVSVLTSTCLMLTQPLQLLFAYCLYVRSVPLLLLSTNLCFYLKRHLFRQHVAGSSFIFLDTVFQFLFCCCCILRYNYHCGGFMSIICYF